MTKIDKKAKFKFCIARRWRKNEPWTGDNVCKYAYGSDTWFGNMKTAQNTLAFIKSHVAFDNPEEAEEYRIVKITYEVIE